MWARTILYNADGLWVIGVDEAVVLENAGKPNLFQLFINPQALSKALPWDTGLLSSVDCVAF